MENEEKNGYLYKFKNKKKSEEFAEIMKNKINKIYNCGISKREFARKRKISRSTLDSFGDSKSGLAKDTLKENYLLYMYDEADIEEFISFFENQPLVRKIIEKEDPGQLKRQINEYLNRNIVTASEKVTECVEESSEEKVSHESVEPNEQAEVVESAESSEQIGTAELTESVKVVESVEPNELTEVVELTESNEQIETAELAVSVKTAKSAEADGLVELGTSEVYETHNNAQNREEATEQYEIVSNFCKYISYVFEDYYKFQVDYVNSKKRYFVLKCLPTIPGIIKIRKMLVLFTFEKTNEVSIMKTKIDDIDIVWFYSNSQNKLDKATFWYYIKEVPELKNKTIFEVRDEDMHRVRIIWTWGDIEWENYINPKIKVKKSKYSTSLLD